MNDENTLDPCPFCGGVAEYVEWCDMHTFWKYVKCSMCGASTGRQYTSKELARAAWNRRVCGNAPNCKNYEP